LHPQESAAFSRRTAGAVSAGRFLDAGAETATAAAAGAKLAILDRDGDAASRVAVEIPGAGYGVIGLFFHVEVEEQVQTAAERALRLMGHCEGIVNNAVACQNQPGGKTVNRSHSPRRCWGAGKGLKDRLPKLIRRLASESFLRKSRPAVLLHHGCVGGEVGGGRDDVLSRLGLDGHERLLLTVTAPSHWTVARWSGLTLTVPAAHGSRTREL
jgi:hypothetical protein